MTVLLPLPDHRPDPMVISVRRPHLDIGSSTNLRKVWILEAIAWQAHVGSAQSTEALAKKDRPRFGKPPLLLFSYNKKILTW